MIMDAIIKLSSDVNSLVKIIMSCENPDQLMSCRNMIDSKILAAIRSLNKPGFLGALFNKTAVHKYNQDFEAINSCKTQLYTAFNNVIDSKNFKFIDKYEF